MFLTACVDDDFVRKAITKVPASAKRSCAPVRTIEISVALENRAFVAVVCTEGTRAVVAIRHEGDVFYPVSAKDARRLNEQFAKEALTRLGQEEAFVSSSHAFVGPFSDYRDAYAIHYYDSDGYEVRYPSPVGPYVSENNEDVVNITKAALAAAEH